MRRENLKKLKRQQELLDSYVKGNRLEFATLPEIEPYVRDTFLMWLSKALERKEQKAKTKSFLRHKKKKKGSNSSSINHYPSFGQ